MGRKLGHWIVGVLGILLIAMGSSRAAPLGSAFTYQGRLLDQGNPANGPYDFQFSVYTESEEGVLVGGPLPQNNITVDDGYFTVSLDFETIFQGDARWLEIKVRPADSGDFTTLGPRQSIRPTPYALYALNAPGGSGFWAGSSDIYNTNSGNVGIGTATPARPLHVQDSRGTIRIDRDENSPSVYMARMAPGDFNTVWKNFGIGTNADGEANGSFFITDMGTETGGPGTQRIHINNEGNVGMGTPHPSEALELGQGNLLVRGLGGFTTGGDQGIVYLGDQNHYIKSEHGFGLKIGTHMAADVISVKENVGYVGIGTTDPQAELDVAGRINGYNPNGIAVRGHSLLDDGVLGRTEASDKSGVFGNSLFGTGVTGRSEAVSGHGVAGFALGANGRGVYGTAETGVGVYGHSITGKAIEGQNNSTNEWVPAIYGQNKGIGDGVYGWSQGRHGTVGISSSSNTNHAGVLAQNNGTGPGLLAKGSGGGYAAVFEGNVLVRTSTGAPLVELGEGLDYAEGFDVTEAAPPAPGTVLVIDESTASKLTFSRTAYDRKVAGIVAGAKGLGSAVRLGVDRFDCDVALAGRVYCNVDAAYGPVKPGDLLTTSPTAGHAMVVKDYTQGQGAILGKAMESLASGKGQILVLVTLQ